MSKRKYDYKKLSRSSILKKKIALFLAEEKYKNDRMNLNVTEILAFGHRPFISYSDKDLIKIVDDMYGGAINDIASLEREANSPDVVGKWGRVKQIEGEVLTKKLLVMNMQPLIDELLEEAFSE